MDFDMSLQSRVQMVSACSSCSNVARSVVDNQYFSPYVPTVCYCVCCDISTGLIRPADLYGTCYMGLLFDMRVLTFPIPLLHCLIMLQNLLFVCTYGIPFSNFIVCNTLDTPQSEQQNGAVVYNNGNLAQLQNTNQYVQPVTLSVLLLL